PDCSVRLHALADLRRLRKNRRNTTARACVILRARPDHSEDTTMLRTVKHTIGKGIAGALSLALAFGAVAVADSIYQQAVDAKSRSDADRERDKRDHPAEILAFAGFKPGMRVADVFGGGGYNAELISHVVGPQGEVVV